MLYLSLPWFAATTAGLLLPGPRARRRGVEITLLVTVLMVALDLVPGGVPPIASGTVAFDGVAFVGQERRADFAAERSLSTLAQAARGDIQGIHELAQRYPPEHPRAVVSSALLKAGFLLMPITLIGIVLGVSTWLSARVTFKSPLDERAVRLLLAWLAPLGAMWLIFQWCLSARYGVLVSGSSLATMLWPYGPFLILAALGWAAPGRFPQYGVGAPPLSRAGDG